MAKDVVTILMVIAVSPGLAFFAGCEEAESSVGPIDQTKSSPKLFRTDYKLEPLVNPVVRIELTISKSQTSQRGRVSQVRKGYCTGSGFIVSADGFIITNDHVIHPGDEHGQFNVDSLSVCFNPDMPNKRIKKAKIVAFDADADIAILKVRYPKPIPVFPLGSSASMELGDSVDIRGYPLGGRFQQTTGKIIRQIQPSKDCPTSILVCDAEVSPGNSGGPVLDIEGRVIGITVAKVNVEWARAAGRIADYGTETLNEMKATVQKKAEEAGMSDDLIQKMLEDIDEGKQDIGDLKKELTQSWVWKQAQQHPHVTYTIASDDVKKLLDKWNINIKEKKN